MDKTRIGIICGGRSAEHEVSLQSAKNVIDALDNGKFEPVLIGIDKSGLWSLYNQQDFLLNSDDPQKIRLNDNGVKLLVHPHSRSFRRLDTNADFTIDAAFPLLHGPFGEDGTVQGLLKLMGIPFAGADVSGSAVGMDKDIMKRLLRDAGIRIGKFAVINADNEPPSYKEAVCQVGEPFFVKPANMGSSIGVQKVHNENEWTLSIKEAFKYDTKVILEENITGREIECAVLDGAELIVSPPGEVKPLHEFYSYEAKYIDKAGALLEIPAALSGEKSQEIKELAVKTFKTLCCAIFARVDFFLTKDGEVFVNEINTIPGFTKISMYPKLLDQCGIGYRELITRIIESTILRFEKEAKLKTSYY
ncbi:MAG: D-alanine--D-alanine ligase [Spirochaetaceae bacterium]|nr:D-alanine--D-alanine ligase [Spirochaetaceae bacterium]